MDDQNRSELEMDLTQTDQDGRAVGSWLCCLPCYWLKRNSSFHKILLAIATLLVTVLLVASPVLFLISSIPGDKSRDCQYQGGDCVEGKGNEKVCLEQECLVAADRILASISWETNPCQDFYRFACGSWKKKQEFFRGTKSDFREDPFINFDTLQQNVDQSIQQLLSSTGESDPLRKLGIFYKSCVRAADKKMSLLPMLALLKDLGGYVNPDREPSQDLTDLILNLLRLNGTPLFDIYLDLDPQNSTKLIPIIDLPFRTGFSTPFKYRRHQVRKYLPNKFKFVTLTSTNKPYNFIKATLEEKRLIVMERILQALMSGNMSSETKTKEAHRTLLFADAITKVYPREKDVAKSYQGELTLKTTLRDLKNIYSFIRWEYLLEKFLKVDFSSEDFVFILAPAYLDDLQRVLPRFESRVVHNGLLLMFATDSLYQLVNTSSARDWPAFCTKVTVTAFGQAVSILYVRQYETEYIDRLRLRVTRIFDSLKKTFEKRVGRVPWLDKISREAVFEKLAALEGQFLTWPELWNATYAGSLLEDVRIDLDNFFGNVIRRYRDLRNVPLDFDLRRSEEKRWTYPFVINAFYILTMNTIVIPLAVLTQPFFREAVPLYIPYSTVGLILAHEILHGFDLKGVGYDSGGKAGALLTPESRARLEARLDCFVKQFSSTFWKKVFFLGTKVDIEFDWNMTKNENMADISGLQIAYEAWKNATKHEENAVLPGVALNAHQLFFVNVAQTYCSTLSPADYIFLVEMDSHTPHPERVNGIMMNSPDFADAYKCPLGSSMNPRKKCFTW